jgi:hypothetical protein
VPPTRDQPSGSPAQPAPLSEAALLDNWLAIQALNLSRHARSLRPMGRTEFGTGPAAPGEAHIDAVNQFIGGLRSKLVDASAWAEMASAAARRDPSPERLRELLERKELVGSRVLFVEGIWDFYFDLFVQRLSAFADRLRTVDRIAANCYEDTYLGVGSAQPPPTLLPFSYADAGFSPATFRRGVPLRRLRFHPNLFPLVTLPQHRLENVWALSSVLHEVSHNLQADLGLWNVMPKLLFERLTSEGGLRPQVASTWARWHKEITADMFALCLGGPAAVESLMDVVGRAPASTLTYSPTGVHPTPYLRTFISLALLRRLGFPAMADGLAGAWRRLYPDGPGPTVPRELAATFDRACDLVVDTIVFQPFPQLAGKSLSEVIRFGPDQMALIEEGGRRLAAGQDTGSTPLRFMIGAARFAVDRRLAPPRTITDGFYRNLGRR